MRKIILSAFFIALAFNLIAQQTITINDLKAKYGAFIKVVKKQSYDDRVYIDKSVVIPKNDSLLIRFVTQNFKLIELIKTNYITVNSSELKSMKDSTAIQSKFAKKLQEDILFNQYLLPIIATFYMNNNFTISDYSLPKQTYSWDNILDIASKYFEVTSVDSRNNFKTRVGISDDGLNKILDKRDPILEVFCLYTIQKNQYQAYKVLNKAKKIIAQLQLGLSDSDKIKRAEGVLYGIVMLDEDFKELFKTTYASHQGSLPFLVE
jgi:hypothetical protein